MQKTAICTEHAPSAIGPYSQAVCSQGQTISVSGQIPIDPATGEFVEGGIVEQTHQCLKNIRAILKEAGASMANVVEVAVMLTDINDFAAMNEVYAEYFESPYPARAAFQVSALPKGAQVEIRCSAVI